MLVVATNANVAPYYPDEVKPRNITGSYVTVTQRFDLKPALAELATAGVTGKLELGNKSTMIGTIPDGAKLETKPLVLAQTAIPDAKLSYALPPPVMSGGMPIPLVGAGAGVAVLGLVLVVIGMMTKPGPETLPYIQTLPTVESKPPPDPGATKLRRLV